MRFWLWILIPLLIIGCSAPAPVEPPGSQPPPPPAPSPAGSGEKQAQPPSSEIQTDCTEKESGPGRIPGAPFRITFLCNGKLWVHDLTTGAEGVLFDPPAGIRDYVWSRAGEYLAYVTGDGTRVIYRDLLTGDERPLYQQPGSEPISLSWSPDGAILLVSPGCCKGRPYIFLELASGKEIGRSHGWRFLWSPDSRRVAVDRSVDAGQPVEGGGSSSAFILEIRDGDVAELPLLSGGKQAGYAFRAFAEDGTLIGLEYEVGTYRTTGWWALAPTSVTPVKIQPGSPQAQWAELQGVDPLIDGMRVSRYAISRSPDGHRILFRWDARPGIYVVDAALAERPVLIGHGHQAQWMPTQAANPGAWRAVHNVLKWLTEHQVSSLARMVVPEGLVVAPTAVGAPEIGLLGEPLLNSLTALTDQAQPAWKAFKVSGPDRAEVLVEGFPVVELLTPTGRITTTARMKVVLRKTDADWRLWMLVSDRDGALGTEACSGGWVWANPARSECPGAVR